MSPKAITVAVSQPQPILKLAESRLSSNHMAAKATKRKTPARWRSVRQDQSSRTKHPWAKHDVTTRLPYLLKNQSALSRPFALACSRALECAEGINGTSQTSALTGSPKISA